MQRLVLGILGGMLLIGCTSSKCDPKTGQSCRVLPETIGLSALTDPQAPSGLAPLPFSLDLKARLSPASEVLIRDAEEDVVSLVYLPFSSERSDEVGFLGRLAGARGYSFSRPQLPDGCRIAQLGYSHIQTGNQSGVLEFSAREPKKGPKPCLGFFRQVQKEGLDIKFTDVPVFADRPPVQIRLDAGPPPERPRTATRARDRGRFSHPAD